MKTEENTLLPSIAQYCHFWEYCPAWENPGFPTWVSQAVNTMPTLKKILFPKNQHLNITDLGYFMPLNRQLTSWITCLKSVADQLIHYDNTFQQPLAHCLQLVTQG